MTDDHDSGPGPGPDPAADAAGVSAAPPGVAVREATPDDVPAVLGVLDGAALETDGEALRKRVERGDVLVAVSGADDQCERAGTVVGALALDGAEIANVAVRRRRRGQGIGTALVAAAAARRERLVAAFDAGVRPFYEALGFEIAPTDERDRYRGERASDGETEGDGET